MHKKINALFVDFDANEDWEFFKGLNQNNDWIIEKKVSNGTHKNLFCNIKRYYKYFSFSFKRFLQRKRYNKIVAWQQFYGIIMCFFLNFFHSKVQIDILIMSFIFKEKKGIKGKIYKWFISKALRCKQLKKIIVLSSYEIDSYSNYFGIPKDKFEFIQMGLDRQIDYPIVKGDYYLSAGRSNRDYDFLVKTFKKINKKLFIISDTYKNDSLTDNIKILSSCFGDEYEKMVANCFAMIISLCDTPISSGQLVANLAMVYKKPIIATNNPGIIDYVINGKNGFIIQKDELELLKVIDLLENDELYSKISDSQMKFSSFDCGNAVLNAISK